MDIVNKYSAVPSNVEVFQFLQENRRKLPTKGTGQGKAATIVLETLNYLDKTPAGKLAADWDREKFGQFFEAVEQFKLTPSETLQILNHCPTSAVEIQLLIEDSEERLSEGQVQDLLDIVKKHLIGETEEEETEGADNNEADGGGEEPVGDDANAEQGMEEES